MFRILFLLFIVLPIIEIAILLEVGAWLGLWPTLAIIIVTAWVGAKKVREQGIATMQSAQLKMAQGEMPSDDIMAGVMLLISGVLLLTPGFVTDILGLSFLWPVTRNAIIKQAKKHVNVATMGAGQGFSSQTFYYHSHSQSQDYTSQPSHETDRNIDKGQTIDGEFERKD